MTNILPKKLEQIHITQSMLDNLDYDKVPEKNFMMTSNSERKPFAMFVFHSSDLDAASYFLAKSLEDPLSPSAIKCVFVQESCLQRFSDKLKAKLKPYTNEALKNPTLVQALNKSAKIIAQLNAKTIQPDAEGINIPTVVLDVPQEHFEINEEPSPIATLYSFRTVKEAAALSKKERFLKSATIWCENHAMAYELISETPLNEYYLNCYNVSWAPIQQYINKGEPYVLIENSYHYETLRLSGNQKSIVFPFGTTFAN